MQEHRDASYSQITEQMMNARHVSDVDMYEIAGFKGQVHTFDLLLDLKNFLQEIVEVQVKKFMPLDSNLIVKMDTGEIKSQGGIILAAEGTREAMSKEEGIIEQMGENAFEDLKTRPKLGDRVYFKRYEGTTLVEAAHSEDKLERRLIQDTRILATIIEE